MLKLTITAAAMLALTACGADKDEEEKDSMLPASIVTAAMLEPGTLKAYDGDVLKEKLENMGSDFADHAPDEDEDDESAGDKCYNDKFNALKVEAKGEELRIAGEIDLSSCLLTVYKDSEAYKDADFTDFVSSNVSTIASYISCSGVDLSKYNGKTFNEIGEIGDCNKDGTKVTVRSESTGSSSTKAKIKGVVFGDTTVTYTVDEASTNAGVTRMADGSPCTATVSGATVTWADGCAEVSRVVSTKGKRGVEGSEEEDEGLGKAEYEKFEYVGLKAAADTTSLWYTGGQMNVTLNDWTGTVEYSSATAEPIFEMKKGSETVTGTVKAPKTDAAALLLKAFGLR